MDFYRKRLNHFGWTWLERKRYHNRSLVPTRLARAYAKRNVRDEIEDEIERHDNAWLDDFDEEWYDLEELRNWDEYRGITWNIPEEFAGDWNN